MGDWGSQIMLCDVVDGWVGLVMFGDVGMGLKKQSRLLLVDVI